MVATLVDMFVYITKNSSAFYKFRNSTLKAKVTNI